MHINGKKVGFNKGFNIKPTVKTYTKANKMLIEVLKMSASANRLNAVDVDNPHYTEFINLLIDRRVLLNIRIR